MSDDLTIDDLRKAVTGTAAAFRCVAEFQPAGGPGDKVFPPTYEGGKYATEYRVIGGAPESELKIESEKGGRETQTRVVKNPPRPCVLLDSVQSQANRMEAALLDAWEQGRIPLPVLTVDFKDAELTKQLRITSLEAPHRIADALLRDSLIDGKAFRKSDLGRRLDDVSNRNATVLFELCPTALVFGMWDSTGPRGGLGAKFARAMVSEIVGIDAEPGRKPSSRRDPAEILKSAGPVFRTEQGDMTLFEDEALKVKGKPVLYGKQKGKDVLYEKGKDQDQGKPSAANHGNVTPSLKDPKTKQDLPGGVTISKALQTTVLSLPALRRLRFPLDGEGRSRPEVDEAARTALAALALCAAALNQEQGCDLRSRCQLHPTSMFVWELLADPGAEPERFSLRADQTVALLREAVEQAKAAGLPWMDKELVLKPSSSLAALVRKSQVMASEQAGEDDGKDDEGGDK